MYKYNPNNMILLFLPKYYYFLFLFSFLFFLQKFTKQIILYIYNPILRRVPGWWWKIDYKGSALSHCKERETRTLTLFRHGCSEEMIPDSSFGSKCLSKAHVWNVSGIFIGLQMASTLLNLVRQNDIVTLGMALTAQCLLHCRVRPTGQGQQDKAQHWIQHWTTAWSLGTSSEQFILHNLRIWKKIWS